MTAIARCLDITRLISRQGRGVPTGVDRVELAYLNQFVADQVPCFLFLRTWAGYLLITPDEAVEIAARLNGDTPWGKNDLLGVLRRKSNLQRRRAEADARRFAIARCRTGQLDKLLARYVPAEIEYYNVGHSNLTDEVLQGWAKVGVVNTLIHDTIPLDYPKYQRAGTVAQFEDRLRTALAHSSRIICISDATKGAVQGWAKNFDLALNRVVTAPIGVTTPVVDLAQLPEPMKSIKGPYFVALGTIEPRKNHELLLDIWAEFLQELPVQEIPKLVIVGARGWENEEIFARLDGSPMMKRQVFEVNDLPDTALGALLERSNGLLFPTYAEGFGLPPIEALALNVPVICSDLPVLRENLQDFPIYARVNDMYLWKQSILQLAGRNMGQTGSEAKATKYAPPTWKDHFNLVLKDE